MRYSSAMSDALPSTAGAVGSVGSAGPASRPRAGLLRRLGSAFSTAILVSALAVGSGCGSSSSTGELGIAQFLLSNCGGVLGDLAGCDLSKRLAIGGLVDVRATTVKGSNPLKLRSDIPDILDVKDLGGSQYTITGKRAGKALLIAADASGDLDRISVQVDEINTIAYSMVSSSAGDFKLERSGSIDGTITLFDGIERFTLLFAQLDNASEKMLGRESFTAMTGPGLVYQTGKEMPRALQFEFVRPTMPGSYPLTILAKNGPAGFRMVIVVK